MIFGNKSPKEPVLDASSIDGPGQPFNIQVDPPGTKRLSKQGKVILIGGAVMVSSLILMGVMNSGQSKQNNKTMASEAAGTDAPGQAAAFSMSPEEIERKRVEAENARQNQLVNGSDNQTTSASDPLSVRGSTSSTPSRPGAQTAGGTAAPPTPAEAHRLWLEKRKYERIQGRILAAESAETSELGKGGGAMAASSRPNSGIGSEDSFDPETGLAAVSQRLSAANTRAANARAMASQEAMRVSGIPAGMDANTSGFIPTSATAGQDPAVAAQARNKAFLKEAAENGYLAEVLKPKIGEHEITAGSVIPAVMLSGINSDLPGTIVAQTRQTVYSTNDPSVILIPQGARLIGRYSADVAYGQERILAAWDEMILPNGARISLRGMAAADGQGQSGIQDQVNNHFWKTWGSALLVSMLGVAAQQSQPQNQGTLNTPSASAQAAAAAMNSLSEVGSKILQKNLNVSPTLQVRPGMTFNVMVNRSIILPSYQ
jgi:type IV secretion system protein VirB10